MAARPPTIYPDAGLALALAVVGSSTAPLLLLDGDLTVVAASTSFFRAFGVPENHTVGRSIFDLGSGEWNVPQLRSLLKATVTGSAGIEAYEMDLKDDRRDTRSLVLNARKLDYGQSEDARVLLAIADVTDARIADRLKDDLLREKAILLQEVQHRVANSLQIIASVILQSARKVRSEETRLHLTDAHNRVMSVATLQQQLAATRLGDVALRAYFDQLCESIGASMIRDHNQLALDVEADDSTVSADVSVSLGLIVTELVINALKHAFPDGRSGKITVGYQSDGSDWALSVRDDGVGMPHGETAPKPGLGTTIVHALATQLRSRIQVSDARPGTLVSIVHGPATTRAEPSQPHPVAAI